MVIIKVFISPWKLSWHLWKNQFSFLIFVNCSRYYLSSNTAEQPPYCVSSPASLVIGQTRTEYLSAPAGSYLEKPQISWWLLTKLGDSPLDGASDITLYRVSNYLPQILILFCEIIASGDQKYQSIDKVDSKWNSRTFLLTL